MRTWDHVLDGTPPSPASPRRCHPPSHYKIYISICHISTPHLSRQASAHWALTLEPPMLALPTANACLGRRWNQVSVPLGLQVLPARVRAQLSSDQVLEKKYTPLQSYTRGERWPGPPSSPDTHDSEEGKKRGGTRPEGRPRGLPWPPSCHCARWPTWPEGWGARAPGPPLT